MWGVTEENRNSVSLTNKITTLHKDWHELLTGSMTSFCYWVFVFMIPVHGVHKVNTLNRKGTSVWPCA